MKLTRRTKDTASAVDPEPDPEPISAGGTTTKGRPTPKRRDSRGARGPVTAPKTRKEAYARQRQMAKSDRVQAGRAPAPAGSAAERRAALRRGDASALPRRDQGATRKLARDYVDSRRMLSNYLLWLFPIMIVSTFVRGLQIVQIAVLALFLVLLVEWYVTGRRIIALAAGRGADIKQGGGPMTIGFYAGSRAYLPRKWRLPAPAVELGDQI